MAASITHQSWEAQIQQSRRQQFLYWSRAALHLIEDTNKSYLLHRDFKLLMAEQADYVLTLDLLTDLIVSYGRAA